MKVGDKVVCIKNASNSFGVGVVKGRVYTINDVSACECGRVFFDVGLPDSGGINLCRCGVILNNSKTVFVISTVFAPIQYNSAHDELINKEIVKETSYIPVKEPQKQEG